MVDILRKLAVKETLEVSATFYDRANGSTFGTVKATNSRDLCEGIGDLAGDLIAGSEEPINGDVRYAVRSRFRVLGLPVAGLYASLGTNPEGFERALEILDNQEA